MDVLIINAGSSSLKYQLVDMRAERLLAKGIVERIGEKNSSLCYNTFDNKELGTQFLASTHAGAISKILNILTDREYGVVRKITAIKAVGHRVAHGGEQFIKSVLITKEVKRAIIDNAALAPIHNPANISGIEACEKLLPGIPQVAVFDTAFHQSMPPKAFLYGIPYDYYVKDKIRRYGFHGTSHRYIVKKVSKLMGKKDSELKIISCHLGNGGSVAAVSYGKSIDTSMGMTPIEGLVMGTRCGDIDPSLIEYIMKRRNMNISEVMKILNKESGLSGVSQNSMDMRDIEASVNNGDAKSIFAYELFCYRVTKYIGAYAAAMNGVDCIVFTGGIGENSSKVRYDILKNFEYLNLKVDKERNEFGLDEFEITKTDSKVKAYVIPTNEELMIAKDTYKIVSDLSA